MSIRVSRILTIDAIPYEVSVEAGSVKEALGFLEHIADDAGAAPEPAAKAPGKRGRRTKAEMEAAKASAATAGQAAPAEQISQPSQQQELGHVFGPPNGHAQTPEAPVGFVQGPLQDFAAHAVGLAPAPQIEAPAPPTIDIVTGLRNDVRREYDAILARVPAMWRDPVNGAFTALVAKQGASFEALSSDSLRTLLTDLQQYGQRCDEALRGGPR